MQKELKYYKPDKDTSQWFYPMAIIMLLVVAPLLSIGYAEVQFFFESVFISIITYGIFLFILLIIVNISLEYTRVANTKISNIYSWIFILIVYYLHWSAYLYISIHEVFNEYGISGSVNLDNSADNYLSIAMQPSTMWTYITLDASFGSWIIWIIELIGFLFIASFSGSEVELEPYSSETDSYFEKTSFPVNKITKEYLIEAISNKDYTNIGFIEKHNIGHESYSIIDVFTLAGEQSYMSLTNVSADISKGGDPSFTETIKIKNIAIDKELKDMLLAIDGNISNVTNEKTKDELQKSNNDSEIIQSETPKSKSKKQDIIVPEIKIQGLGSKKFINIILEIFVMITGIVISVLSSEVYMIIFGLIIIGGALFSITTSILAPDIKNKVIIKINPTYLIIDKDITENQKDMTIRISDIDRNVYAETSKENKFTIYLKPNNTLGLDYINLPLSTLNVNTEEFTKSLDSLLGSTIEDRMKILKIMETKIRLNN